MPLRTPVLDDRSYAQLRDELIARIPVYAPEWTDHHPSDPGITLIELFAFLGENLLYRFNQIPDATKMAFLQLLDIPLMPAVPATGMVRFETDAAAVSPVESHTRLLAGDVAFQTLQEVTVWPVTARAAIRARVTEPLDPDTSEYLARASAAAGTSSANAASYRTTFGASRPSRPGGDVLDPSTAIDNTLFVALTSEAADLTGMASGLLTIGVVPASEVPTMADRDPCPGAGFQLPSPAMQWQVCTTTPASNGAQGTDPDAADPLWRDLDVVADASAGLTAPGVVRLELPPDVTDIGVYVPANPDAVGTGDQPPLVEDPEIDDTLVAWLRVFRPDGGPIPPVEWVGANAADVEQAVTARAEFLGTGTGEPGQELPLVHPDVLGTIELEVEEQGAGRWVPWRQQDSLRASDVDDRHFTVDAESGLVRCGDGRRGRPWQIGERIRARSYRYGGGAAGNVGPAALTKAPGVAGVKVTNDLPVRGGADAEPLADAVARIPEEFRRHDRAVTLSDFRELAEATPGAGVIRAETLRLFHPATPEVEVPGAVSVVVWSPDPKHPQAPRTDRTTLDAVCRYLDDRRLVTTEVHVIPPTYRRIALSVGIAVKAGFGIESVRRWVELILRQYLAPVPPYGPEGRGWPLGRSVFGPELEAAALQVEGLEYLEGLRLAEQVSGSAGSAGSAAAVWSEQADRRVTLKDWEVPDLAEISVVTGPPLEPGLSPEPPTGDGPAVPVRSPREVC